MTKQQITKPPNASVGKMPLKKAAIPKVMIDTEIITKRFFIPPHIPMIEEDTKSPAEKTNSTIALCPAPPK